jgi:hypothetical protein
MNDHVSFRRAEWQRKAYWVATWLRWLFLIAYVPDVLFILEYHFALTADVLLPITYAGHAACAFVQRHTKMYAGDIL